MNKKETVGQITKPRSQLQVLSSQTNWVINFRLHKLATCYIRTLKLTTPACEALLEYNKAVDKLKKELKASYEHNKNAHNKLSKK